MELKAQIRMMQEHLKELYKITTELELPTTTDEETEQPKEEELTQIEKDINRCLKKWKHQIDHRRTVSKSLEKAALLCLLYQYHNLNMPTSDCISAHFAEPACHEAKRILFSLPEDAHKFIQTNERSQIKFTDLIYKERRLRSEAKRNQRV